VVVNLIGGGNRKKITEPNHICGAMVSVLASSTEDHVF
jgi:hypothetical protein